MVRNKFALLIFPKQQLLKQLDAQISARILAASTGNRKPDPPNPEMRRKLDALHLIIQDADKAATQDKRIGYLREFLDKSGPFVAEYPSDAQIWMLRGAAAVELRDGGLGQEAAFHLMKLALDTSKDERVRLLMAKMDRQGWIYDMNLKPEPLVTAFNDTLKVMGAALEEDGGVTVG